MYHFSTILDTELLVGDEVKQFVIFFLLNRTEGMDHSILQLDFKVERSVK